MHLQKRGIVCAEHSQQFRCRRHLVKRSNNSELHAEVACCMCGRPSRQRRLLARPPVAVVQAGTIVQRPLHTAKRFSERTTTAMLAINSRLACRHPRRNAAITASAHHTLRLTPDSSSLPCQSSRQQSLHTEFRPDFMVCKGQTVPAWSEISYHQHSWTQQAASSGGRISRHAHATETTAVSPC